MLHCLAYGNSDQASFRDPEVRACLDVMSVPSTIATYYPDATAAFVLSSDLEYLIEPRTPLFQEWLREPRASHYTLAATMGPTIAEYVGAARTDQPHVLHFPPDFYTADLCDEMVSSMISFQREYGGRAERIAEKLDRYRSLLDRAHGGSGEIDAVDERRGPRYVLSPYFAVESLSSEWWEVTQQIWQSARVLERADGISPVVSISRGSLLAEAVRQVPSELSSTVFFWIPGFDERRVSSTELRLVRESVSELSNSYELVNLYGGYFSILLSKFGLFGFNNGLGYSESREWPTLDATGAAPARYYVRRLHAFMPTAVASTLIEHDAAFACECSVCGGTERLPSQLGYHELKRHFALARAWEIEQSAQQGLPQLCDDMRSDAQRVRAVRRHIPSNIRIPSDHLLSWADALE